NLLTEQLPLLDPIQDAFNGAPESENQNESEYRPRKGGQCFDELREFSPAGPAHVVSWRMMSDGRPGILPSSPGTETGMRPGSWKGTNCRGVAEPSSIDGGCAVIPSMTRFTRNA